MPGVYTPDFPSRETLSSFLLKLDQSESQPPGTNRARTTAPLCTCRLYPHERQAGSLNSLLALCLGPAGGWELDVNEDQLRGIN